MKLCFAVLATSSGCTKKFTLDFLTLPSRGQASPAVGRPSCQMLDFKNMKPRYIIFFVFILVPHQVFSAEPRPVGNNCALSSPPEGSGELVQTMGTLYSAAPFMVFPRTKDMGPDYDGCQAIWISRTNEIKWPLPWSMFLLVEFKNGAVARTWSPDAAFSESNKCRFDRGRLASGNHREGFSIDLFPLKSMRPGCLKAMLRIDNSEHGLQGCTIEE